MQYTTNYNFNLPEGSDLWNYLTQTNPNFSNLDSIIKGVSDLTVTPATEVTTGTAHAISKTLADATVIKFTATSNWQTGDTMTLDGNPVTPLKTDGTTLKTGDYIIGSAVLMIQDGTRLTVLVASSPDAGDINYDNTVSGLTANKVQGAVDELAADVNTINSNFSGLRDVSLSSDFSRDGDTWTAPYDGFVWIYTNESISGTGYIYFIEGATPLANICVTNGSGGLTYTSFAPVQKNHNYKLVIGGFTWASVAYYTFHQA